MMGQNSYVLIASIPQALIQFCPDDISPEVATGVY